MTSKKKLLLLTLVPVLLLGTSGCIHPKHQHGMSAGHTTKVGVSTHSSGHVSVGAKGHKSWK